MPSLWMVHTEITGAPPQYAADFCASRRAQINLFERLSHDINHSWTIVLLTGGPAMATLADQESFIKVELLQKCEHEFTGSLRNL